jgi:hypothetical protein
MHPFIVKAEGGGKARINPCFKIESMGGSHVFGGSEQRPDVNTLRFKTRTVQHTLEQSLTQSTAQFTHSFGQFLPDGEGRPFLRYCGIRHLDESIQIPFTRFMRCPRRTQWLAEPDQRSPSGEIEVNRSTGALSHLFEQGRGLGFNLRPEMVHDVSIAQSLTLWRRGEKVPPIDRPGGLQKGPHITVVMAIHADQWSDVRIEWINLVGECGHRCITRPIRRSRQYLTDLARIESMIPYDLPMDLVHPQSPQVIQKG